MINLKKTIAGVMALATVVTALTACSGDQTASSDNEQTSAPETTTTNTTMGTDSGVQEAVSNVSVNEEYKDIKVDTKLVWMAWWEIQEASPAVEMFKTLYGTPATKPEGYDHVPDENVFCNINVPVYADRYVDLAKRVSSDDSPDCFPFEIGYYPYGIYKNLFQSVDGIIDLTTDDWADYKDVIDMFQWGGKNYCPIMELTPTSFLWYRKSVIEEAGFEDPWTLFENGDWNWSAFMEMCRKFADPENGMYALDGYNPENLFVCSTGTPLVALEDGKLVSNLNNANIEKCMDMLMKFDTSQENLRYPRDVENNWTVNYRKWVNGQTLFFEDGIWAYESNWCKYIKLMKWEEDEVNFVPFPTMDDSDTYYHSMKQDAIMLCAGAKNVDGYKAWIYANLVATKDPTVKAAARQQSIDNYQWTEELLDRVDLVKDPGTFTPVFDFKNGLGPDIADGSSQDTIVEQLTKYPYMTGASYTQIRESNQGQINTRIEEMNASVQ
ncbi:MAG: extracellular solute-binding protein [Ruminococcaceae bacterium]|nr:extracellular solute-binding protein [Oscillospiraceae bacterium]